MLVSITGEPLTWTRVRQDADLNTKIGNDKGEIFTHSYQGGDKSAYAFEKFLTR